MYVPKFYVNLTQAINYSGMERPCANEEVKESNGLHHCEPYYKVAVDVPGIEVLPELKRGGLT